MPYDLLPILFCGMDKKYTLFIFNFLMTFSAFECLQFPCVGLCVSISSLHFQYLGWVALCDCAHAWVSIFLFFTQNSKD